MLPIRVLPTEFSECISGEFDTICGSIGDSRCPLGFEECIAAVAVKEEDSDELLRDRER